MASFGTNFEPARVMLGRSGTSPYMWTGAGPKPPILPGKEAPQPGATPPQPSGTIGPESVRATGAGPFDAAYRQNLATYAGGQYARPSGSLSFNPTDLSSFPGQPTGGGNAPVLGMPNTLLDMALGGQGASWTPPKSPQTSVNPPNFSNMRQWMNQFLMNGRNGRMGAMTA